MSDTPTKQRGGRRWLAVVAVVATALVTFGITALLTNIFDRKEESRATPAKMVELSDATVDPEVWGQNYPREYDSFMKTREFDPSNHSTKLVANQPTAGDPRTETTASKLDEDPRLKIMWDGYLFAKDYRHARGHDYMFIDQNSTKRVLEAKPPGQPGACLNCHASTVSIMNELGHGDLHAGFDAMNKMLYKDAAKLAKGPVGCVDCHDPKTMELRISRPALIEGLKVLKASEGVKDYDVNKDATREEMRTYVCAQCHVEYYFKGDEKTLTFPFHKGTDIDDEFAYYQEVGFTDFAHKRTEAKIVKAQHPEFEIWSQGIHAANGVSCADCHMSYTREGSTKISNHNIKSPMIDPNASCGTCHTASDAELKQRVTTIQDTFIASRDRSFDALTQLIADIEKAMKDPATPKANLDLAREYQNKASFYVDYVYSENSYGFHAPDYEQRILNQSLDAARMGQLALRGATKADLEPSTVSKANAQAAAKATGMGSTSAE